MWAGLLAGAALMALSAAGAASQQPRLAPAAGGAVVRVVQVSGEVRWRAAAGGQWQALRVGMQLSPGDWVRTGPDDAFAELVYIGEAARLWVEPGTLLQIGAGYQALARVRSEERGLPAFRAAFLQAGRLWVRVVSGLSRLWRFEVQTPTAVAGVRGTLFRLEVTPAGETWLYVREGAVELRTPRLRVLVREGESAGTTPTGRAPREFVEESEAEAARLGWEEHEGDDELERESERERLAWLRWLQEELEDDLLEDESLRRALLEQARSARDAARSGLVEWLLGLEKAAAAAAQQDQEPTSGDDEGDSSQQGQGRPQQGAEHDEHSDSKGPDSGSGSDAGHPDDSEPDEPADDDEGTPGHHEGEPNGSDDEAGGPSHDGRQGWWR